MATSNSKTRSSRPILSSSPPRRFSSSSSSTADLASSSSSFSAQSTGFFNRSTTSPKSTTSNSRIRPSGPVLSYGFQASSPPQRFCSLTSSGFASASSSFSARSTGFLNESTTSPKGANLNGSFSSSSSVRFSIDRPPSPRRAIAVSPRDQVVKKQSNPISAQSSPRRTCMCSPTNHPGSFRCSLHRGVDNHLHHAISNRLDVRRSAMRNSLVRICTVEGELIKRSLATLIRPSSHQQKRRAAFQPRPSRLSIMSKAED